MNEEIMVRFGSDLSGLATGLRGVKGIVQDVGNNIKNSLREAFSNFAAPLSVAGGVSALVESFRSLREEVQTLTRISDSTGLDTTIIQQITNIGKGAGIAAGEIEGLLDKFVKGLAPGSNPEQQLMAIADKIASIQDPATRAQVATEAFGKSGMKLIPILKDGSAGVREMAESWGMLSEAQIDTVNRADETLDKIGHKLKIFSAQWLEGFQTTAEKMKDMPAWKKIAMGPLAVLEAIRQGTKDGGDEQLVTSKALQTPAEMAKAKKEAGIAAAQELSAKEELFRAKPEEKVLILTRQILALRREMELTTDDEKRARLGEKALDLEKSRAEVLKDIQQKEKQREKERDDAAKALKTLYDQMASAQTAGAQAKSNENGSDNYPTIGELAKSGYRVFRHNQWEWQPGPFAKTAQEIQGFRARQINDREWGNEKDAQWAKGQIDTRMDFLRENHALPQSEVMNEMSEHLSKIWSAIDELNRNAKENGLKIQTNDPNSGHK